VNQARELAIAAVRREEAQWEAAAEAARLAPRSTRRTSESSIVFSVRLDPREVAALEARAALIGIGPSVLARNLIRTGLAAWNGDTVAAVVDQLEAVVSELRAVIS
jgi:glycine cleavage system pyridoxal-binding protein P